MDRFRRPIWYTAYRFSRTSDDADELAQDIFMHLLTVLPAYNPSGALGAWVRRVATNMAIDAYRRRRRIPLLLGEEAIPESSASPWWRPDTVAERREEAARMRKLLDRLPPTLSEPVILRDLMDLDYREIAERLGIPVGTVKSRIHRGRSTLARLRSGLQTPSRKVRRRPARQTVSVVLA